MKEIVSYIALLCAGMCAIVLVAFVIFACKELNEMGKMTADQKLEKLGFRKNKSSCYNEKQKVFLYEKSVQNGTDSFEIYFYNGEVVYWNTSAHALWMNAELVSAINDKMKEMGW